MGGRRLLIFLVIMYTKVYGRLHLTIIKKDIVKDIGTRRGAGDLGFPSDIPPVIWSIRIIGKELLNK